MVQLNFNATTVKPNTALEPIPTGIYDVMITKSEQKPTKSGTGSYIELEMTVQGGEFSGRKVFDRLNTNNPNETAVTIAYATLSAICHVTGRLQIQETSQLHGVPFKAVVKKVPRDDRPDTMTNEVAGYKDINGNDPGFAGQNAGGGAPNWATNQQQQVQQQPVQQQMQQNTQQQFQGQPQQQQYDPNQQQQQPQQQMQQQQPVQQQPVQQGQPMQQGGAPAGDTPPWLQPK